jgi:hypothetical protein
LRPRTGRVASERAQRQEGRGSDAGCVRRRWQTTGASTRPRASAPVGAPAAPRTWPPSRAPGCGNARTSYQPRLVGWIAQKPEVRPRIDHCRPYRRSRGLAARPRPVRQRQEISVRLGPGPHRRFRPVPAMMAVLRCPRSALDRDRGPCSPTSSTFGVGAPGCGWHGVRRHVAGCTDWRRGRAVGPAVFRNAAKTERGGDSRAVRRVGSRGASMPTLTDVRTPHGGQVAFGSEGPPTRCVHDYTQAMHLMKQQTPTGEREGNRWGTDTDDAARMPIPYRRLVCCGVCALASRSSAVQPVLPRFPGEPRFANGPPGREPNPRLPPARL